MQVSGFESDSKQSGDNELGSVHLFDRRGTYLETVEAFEQFRDGQWVGRNAHGAMWLTDGWLVYSSGYEVVFAKVEDRR